MINLDIHGVTDVKLDASFVENSRMMTLSIEAKDSQSWPIRMTLYGLTDDQMQRFIDAFGLPSKILTLSPTDQLIEERVRREVNAILGAKRSSTPLDQSMGPAQPATPTVEYSGSPLVDR